MDITPQRRKELALQLEVNEQYLYQCLSGRREMGAIEAVRIEQESGGVLTRRMLCSKTWQRIWPELPAEDKPAPSLRKPCSYAGPERRTPEDDAEWIPQRRRATDPPALVERTIAPLGVPAPATATDREAA